MNDRPADWPTVQQLDDWAMASVQHWKNLRATNPGHDLDHVPTYDAIRCKRCQAELTGETMVLTNGCHRLPPCKGAP